jgi:hypothetical protein
LVHYDYNAWDGAGEGSMAELIERLVAGIGIDHNAAKTANATTRQFIADTCGKVGDAFGEIVDAALGVARFV